MRRSLFEMDDEMDYEMDDDVWNEFIEEMEAISCNSDEDGNDEGWLEISEESGLVTVRDSQGNTVSFSYSEYIETLKNRNNFCPVCYDKGPLGISIVHKTQQFHLWCHRCDITLKSVEGVLCVLGD